VPKSAESRPDAPQFGQKGPFCARYFWGKALDFPSVLAISAENARGPATRNAIFRAGAAAQFTSGGPVVGADRESNRIEVNEQRAETKPPTHGD